jgi:hypothetical protein
MPQSHQDPKFSQRTTLRKLTICKFEDFLNSLCNTAFAGRQALREMVI